MVIWQRNTAKLQQTANYNNRSTLDPWRVPLTFRIRASRCRCIFTPKDLLVIPANAPAEQLIAICNMLWQSATRCQMKNDSQIFLSSLFWRRIFVLCEWDMTVELTPISLAVDYQHSSLFISTQPPDTTNRCSTRCSAGTPSLLVLNNLSLRGNRLMQVSHSSS